VGIDNLIESLIRHIFKRLSKINLRSMLSLAFSKEAFVYKVHNEAPIGSLVDRYTWLKFRVALLVLP